MELQRASSGANVCNSTGQQLFPGTGRSSHFYRQILESTAQLYNENTGIKEECQSLLPYLSHIPEISSQHPQGDHFQIALFLPHLTIKTKNVETNTVTQSIILSFLYLERCSSYRSPDSRLQEWALGNPPFSYKIHHIIEAWIPGSGFSIYSSCGFSYLLISWPTVSLWAKEVYLNVYRFWDLFRCGKGDFPLHRLKVKC